MGQPGQSGPRTVDRHSMGGAPGSHDVDPRPGPPQPTATAVPLPLLFPVVDGAPPLWSVVRWCGGSGENAGGGPGTTPGVRRPGRKCPAAFVTWRYWIEMC